MTVLEVLSPGVQASIQDAGRKGYSHLGISASGYADPYSADWANKLVGNPQGAALIEVLMGGFSAKALSPMMIAICGAHAPVYINQKAVPSWQTHALEVGDELSLGHAKQGLRCYLAIAGQLSCQPVFQSCSTNIREKLGGLDWTGKSLQTGDQLPFSDHYATAKQATARQVTPRPATVQDARVPDSAIPSYQGLRVLRWLPGYQYQTFAPDVIQALNSQLFKVGNRQDRTGVQLIGDPVSIPKLSLRSEGLCYGAIQVPPDGQPIVMLNERPTIGGYVKLGSLLQVDCWRLAQCPPDTQVRLMQVSHEEAQQVSQLTRAKIRQTSLQVL